MSDGPITVAEFNALVSRVVTTSDPITNIVITGEISEIKEYPSGFYSTMTSTVLPSLYLPHSSTAYVSPARKRKTFVSY